MKYWIPFLIIGALMACKKKQVEDVVSNEVEFVAPSHFPDLVYDTSANPVTQEGFELGKKLFMDGRLSRDGSISCAHCHMSSAGFTQHGHALAHGIDNRSTERNVPPIQNLAWQKEFAWDGGVFHLDLFAVAPIENPVEMDESLSNVLEKLREDTLYPTMFKAAFGSDSIQTDHFLKALAQFQLMCVSCNSAYDKHLTGVQNLSGLALEGMEVFNQKCASCHSGVLFTDQTYRNNGLPRGNSKDIGRGRITEREEDHYKFKVPSLRNLSYTFPYMHDGRFETIDEVLDHYDTGVEESTTLDSLLQERNSLGIALTDEEKIQLKMFLKALDDADFVNNKLIEVF